MTRDEMELTLALQGWRPYKLWREGAGLCRPTADGRMEWCHQNLGPEITHCWENEECPDWCEVLDATLDRIFSHEPN